MSNPSLSATGVLAGVPRRKGGKQSLQRHLQPSLLNHAAVVEVLQSRVQAFLNELIHYWGISGTRLEGEACHPARLRETPRKAVGNLVCKHQPPYGI